MLNDNIFGKLHSGGQDENDNAPVFERDKYEAEIAENSPAGTFVIKVLPLS